MYLFEIRKKKYDKSLKETKKDYECEGENLENIFNIFL